MSRNHGQTVTVKNFFRQIFPKFGEHNQNRQKWQYRYHSFSFQKLTHVNQKIKQINKNKLKTTFCASQRIYSVSIDQLNYQFHCFSNAFPNAQKRVSFVPLTWPTLSLWDCLNTEATLLKPSTCPPDSPVQFLN